MQMNKFLVSSRFLYGTVGKYRYPVAEFAGGQAVRDIDRCFSVNQVVELAVYLVFSHRVKGCGGFVKYYHGSVFIKRTGNSHFLLLAARKLHAVLVKLFEHHSVPALGERVYLVQKSDLFIKLVNLFGGVLFTKQNVILGGKCQKLEILENYREALHIFVIVVFTDIHAVQKYLAACYIVQSAQKLYECGLSRTVKPYDGKLFAAAELYGDIMQDFLVRSRIFEAYIPELYLVAAV